MKPFVLMGSKVLTLATLTRAVKRHAPNPVVTDEDALNSLIGPYVRAGRIKNRNGDELILDKQRTSRILNGKEDVPRALRKSLGRVGIEEGTAENVRESMEELVDPFEMEALESEILALVDEDSPRCAALLESKKDPVIFLTRALLEAIRAPNEPGDCQLLWSLGTGSLSLRAGDLLDAGFKNRARTTPIVVVPVDTSFETHVRSAASNGACGVSPQSIHGQWLRRISDSGTRRWDVERRIGQSLARKAGSPGESGRYPRGTIVEFVTQRAVYYLVALSELDEMDRGTCTKEDVSSVLHALAAYYDRRGQAVPLFIPLMGTGLSRANLSVEEALSLTMDAFAGGDCPPKGTVTIMVPENIASRLRASPGGAWPK